MKICGKGVEIALNKTTGLLAKLSRRPAILVTGVFTDK